MSPASGPTSRPRCCHFRRHASSNPARNDRFQAHCSYRESAPDCSHRLSAVNVSVNNLISMDDRKPKGAAQRTPLRDRRYAIRFPFAADAELLDLETGAHADGVTSDVSLGGCFICTSRPFPLKSRTRITLTRKGEKVEALATVRIVKPRIGMGIEFIDIDNVSTAILSRWLEQLRRTR